jgi:hypothetical protein
VSICWIVAPPDPPWGNVVLNRRTYPQPSNTASRLTVAVGEPGAGVGVVQAASPSTSWSRICRPTARLTKMNGMSPSASMVTRLRQAGCTLLNTMPAA